MSDRVFKIKLLQSVLSFSENGAPNSVENLMPYLERERKKLSDKDIANLLLQIDYCLLCLHKEDTVSNLLSDSQISMLNKLNRDILTKSAGIDEAAKRDDMKSLEKVYCCILTGGKKHTYSDGITLNDVVCSDPDIALDILKKLPNEKDLPTIGNVLEHPFHWSNFNKVYFICRATEYLNRALKQEPKKSRQQVLEKYNMGNNLSVVTDTGWIEKLRLSEKETMQIRKELDEYEDSLPFCPNTIYDLAVKPPATKTDREKSVFELARFFRNRYTHFVEDHEHVKLCFGNYPIGYFKFFSGRFPKFFMHVYNNMVEYVCGEDALNEFKNLESFSRSLYTVQHFSNVEAPAGDREGVVDMS